MLLFLAPTAENLFLFQNSELKKNLSENKPRRKTSETG